MSKHAHVIESPRHGSVRAAVLDRPSPAARAERPGDTRWARWLRQTTDVTADGHRREPGLDELIESVRAASRQSRIVYRDWLAGFGVEAIEAVRPWLADPEFGAFAVRVIQATATGDAREAAIAALRRGRRTAATPAIKQDIEFALDQLDARRRTRPVASV